MNSPATVEDCAHMDSPIHRLDPRAKVAQAFLVALSCVSLPPMDMTGVAMHLVFPVALATLGFVPLGLIFKRLLVASPFVLAIALWAPLIDRQPIHVGLGLTTTAGWLVFASIVLRFIATAGTLVVLAATTPLNEIVAGLRWMGIPAPLVSLVAFVYRYLFTLMHSARVILLAGQLRAGPRVPPMGTWSMMIGSLLASTLTRAQAVQLAMDLRGFKGKMPIAPMSRARPRDYALVVMSILALLGIQLVVRYELFAYPR